jgi:hypothetical protein
MSQRRKWQKEMVMYEDVDVHPHGDAVAILDVQGR